MSHYQELPRNARPLGLSDSNSIRREPPKTLGDLKDTTTNDAYKRLGIGPSSKDSTKGGKAPPLPTAPGDRSRTTTQSHHPFAPTPTDRGYDRRKPFARTFDAEGTTGQCKVTKRRKDENEDEPRPSKKPKREHAPPPRRIAKRRAPSMRVKKEDCENAFIADQGTSGRKQAGVKTEKGDFPRPVKKEDQGISTSVKTEKVEPPRRVSLKA